MKIGIIGGSGLYSIEGLNFVEDIEINTKFGKPSSVYKHFKKENNDLFFLSRHGFEHNIAPHKINYRANISGFKELGVDEILSFNAVGAISENLKPSDIILLTNAIDMTWGRVSTFFDESEIVHIDFTNPFCQSMAKNIMNFKDKLSFPLKIGGVYICTNGPRLETAAEIKMYRMIGADVVGMTLFPEAPLAREAEICYQNISIVTNYAAGIFQKKLTTDEVTNTVTAAEAKIREFIVTYCENAKSNKKCECKSALIGSKISRK